MENDPFIVENRLKFNIAIENDPFIVDLPIENGDVP